jgi:tetratricopeptide (TPR) repeat protein
MEKATMKLNSIGRALLVSTLPATVLLAQNEQQRLNEAMQMQRGIYSQDAAGDLDKAIEIYRELAGPRTSDRALAAEAQYRLSQALLQKGDMIAASDALVQLAANFPDQTERVSSLAGSETLADLRGVALLGARFGGGGAAPGTAPSGQTEAEALAALERRMLEMQLVAAMPNAAYDRDFVAGGTLTLTTVVENLSWTNPQSWLRVSEGATKWNLLLPAPNRLLRLGMTRESLPVGTQVRVVLTMDARNEPLPDGSSLGRVEQIVRLPDEMTIFDRAEMLAESERALNELREVERAIVAERALAQERAAQP